MRVLFLPNGSARIPSARTRAYQLLEPLQAAGLDAVALDPSTLPARLGGRTRLYRLAALRAARPADIVVIQKRLFDRATLLMLTKANRRLIYDFDDALYRSTNGPVDPRRMKRFKASLRRSDHVFAGNEVLAGYARRLNPSVTVIPTAVDMERYPLREFRRDEPVVIGWVGTEPNIRYLEAVRPVLRALAEAHPGQVRIRILSSKAPEWPEVPLEFEPWTLSRAIAGVREFDVGLMPLADDEWTRGKCGFKALEYMALGVAPVVSPVGVLRRMIRPGRTGFFAETETEWYEAIATLIGDASLRERVGRAGRTAVSADYSMRVTVPRIVEALRAVA